MNDEPDKQVAGGFEGFDNAADPTKLPPGMCAEGLNVWCKGDGYVETRPGLSAFRLGSPTATMGAVFWTQPGVEYLVVFYTNTIIRYSDLNSSSIGTTLLGSGPAAYCHPVALLDRVFWLDAGVLHSLKPSVGAASHATVTLFADGAAMPTWSRIAVQNFRLLAFEPNGEKLYTSQIGAADTAANWVRTDNIRVGDGDGDPASALIAGQAGYVLMLNRRSCWQIDISDATVANWSSLRVTKLTGCAEGRTAIAIGQDVCFLSPVGIVSLGALSATDSISPSSTLSAPIQPYIDRINWSAIGNAFALKWRELVLFALPLDAETIPTRVFPFHRRTRRWQAPWQYSNGGLGIDFGVNSAFAGKEETVVASNTQLLVVDDTTTGDHWVAATDNFASWALLRRMDHGANQQYKQPLYVELVFQGNTGVDTMVSLRRDGASALTSAGAWSEQVGTTFTGGGGLEKKRWLARSLGRYREAALQVWATSGKLKLREAQLSAFVDPPFYT